nr:hypothetical protein OH826_31255 [Streptomyces sp. NBC_00899]
MDPGTARGGPRTIGTFHALGALDRLEPVVLPMLFGGGTRLAPALDPAAGLAFQSRRALPGGSVEIVHACGAARAPLPVRPASQA